MAQHIGIEKMNESGETLIECEVNFAEVINASTDKLKEEIEKVASFIKEIDVHQYLKFMGV